MVKPPLQFTRPIRSQPGSEEAGVRPAPSPSIDLESPEVQAFSLRGRITVPSLAETERVDSPEALAPTPGPQLPAEDEPIPDDPWRHAAVKLPALSGRKLSEIADLRCSKQTRVALELLEQPLRELAKHHRAGACPPLRRVSAGVARSGVSLILPEDLAEELRYVVQTRGAIKAQILARLLVPAIDALYMREILRRTPHDA